MESKTFAVQEVTDTLTAVMALAPSDVDLGAAAGPATRGAIAGARRRLRAARGCRSFILSWQGDRSPRGARVLGRELGWAQHGCVRDADGDVIGTYDWLSDERDDRRMLVFIAPA